MSSLADCTSFCAHSTPSVSLDTWSEKVSRRAWVSRSRMRVDVPALSTGAICVCGAREGEGEWVNADGVGLDRR